MPAGIVKPRAERQLQTEWLGSIATYLFLGGVGAGAYAVAAAASFLGWTEVANMGVILSFPLVIIGSLVLASHLGKPGRAMLAMSKPGSSWISRGIMFIGAFVVLSIAHYVLKTPPVILPILGLISALLVMIYTGALISGAKGYPLWRTAILPVLFLISGCFTGLCAVFVGIGAMGGAGVSVEQLRYMALMGAGIVVVEYLVILFFLHSAYRTRDSKEAAVRIVKKGSFVFVDLILGLAVPMIIMMVMYFGMPNAEAGGLVTAGLIAGVLGLIGGFVLRSAILHAGMQTSLDISGFQFRPIARLDFEHSEFGRIPPS